MHACTATGNAAEFCMLVQPQAMLPEVFATSQNKQLHHLMVDASKPSDTPDFDCIQALQAKDFDLVLSLEVLEHVPGDQSHSLSSCCITFEQHDCLLVTLLAEAYCSFCSR